MAILPYPGKIAVATFAMDRPQYLERLVESMYKLENAGPCDYHFFVDGTRNRFNGKFIADVIPHNDVIRFLSLQNLGDEVHLHLRTENVGIAIQQYEAYNTLAEQYRYVVWLDDDVVLGKDWMRIARLMATELLEREDVFSVTPGFRRYCPPNEIEAWLSKYYQTNTNWIGILADMQKWPAVREVYWQYYELVKDNAYRERDNKAIQAMFAKNGWPNKATSQDGGKDMALKVLGLKKYIMHVNRGLYIGEHGEHGNPEGYKKSKWAEFQPFVWDGDDTLDHLEES